MSEHDKMLMSRHIYPEQGDVVCDNCSGTGVKVYGSTAKWSGGVGGQILTNGVCDKCWGSGKSNEPWPSHRRIAELEAENARLRPNAERYAWLRDWRARRDGEQFEVRRFEEGLIGRPGKWYYPSGEILDAAIDAARKP